MTPDADTGRTLSVGELARITGLTVRTLHHYDRLGLLSPARDRAGRRWYGPAEVRRLHRILALRGFGLSLAEIGDVLDGAGTDLRELLHRQLEQTEERIAAAQRLRRTLLAVIDASARNDEGAGPSADELVELIEVMMTMDRKLTREEFEQMNRRRQEAMARLSPEEAEELQRRRAEMASRLGPEELEEMSRRRRRLLPEGLDAADEA
ncbi:MerR family transcriptional regulator [Actinoallomurus spadix]|uniref:MerR family transcriptional regulator n=1 Tax=Actinoallomurus spadix TaxID=79912 RepID=A0ABP3FZV9_9ACTN|nr:MerR family transcriptional regulator [Actinoallomurus spadix]MCO5988533.1 MerR family transcriptional regulator [Actinoallomurus spadix]